MTTKTNEQIARETKTAENEARIVRELDAHLGANEQSEDEGIALEVVQNALSAAGVASRTLLDMGGLFLVVERTEVFSIFVHATVVGANKRGALKLKYDVSEQDSDGYVRQIGTLKQASDVAALIIGHVALAKL